MRRAVKFFALAVVCLALAWWVSAIPGTITARSGSYTVETSAPVGIFLLVLCALVLTVLLRLLGHIRRAPGGLVSWRSARGQKQGEAATLRGMVALAAGDGKAAEAEGARARKWLGDAPLALLLAAEAARLNGKAEQARELFAKLAAHRDVGFLGHRGLAQHALDATDHEAAETHAKAAEAAYPGSRWAQGERLAMALRKQDWHTALRLSREPKETAAIATAAAAGSTNVREGLKYARTAVKANPGLAPAIAAYANSLTLAGRARAARKTLLKGWTATPHPMLAAAFLADTTAPIERVQQAGVLAAARPGHGESELLLAQTSQAARLTGEARRHAQNALKAGLTDKRVYAVLTALGDAPVDAPAPTWQCDACHTEHANWSATCPDCGKAGTLTWKTNAKSAG